MFQNITFGVNEMATKQNEIERVAGDDGFAAIKLAWWKSEGDIATLEVPSLAQRGVVMTSMANETFDTYETDGEVFSVDASTGTAMEPTQINNYSASAVNRVLLTHTLVKAGFGGREIMLATGLPVDAYFQDDTAKAKRESLKVPVKSMNPNHVPPKIVQHRIYPQAIMAYMDHVIDANGESNANAGKRIGIVDVGGRTSDFAIIAMRNNQPMIERPRSGSVNIGLLSVSKRLEELLKRRFPQVQEIGEGFRDAAIRASAIRLFGQSHDVTEEIQTAARDVAAQLTRETESKFGSGADIDQIIYVGGGAVVMSDALKKYPHLTVVPNPTFANARGMLKYMTYVDDATAVTE